MLAAPKRYFRSALVALSALWLAGAHLIPEAEAQTYPGRSIRLIAPYPPGGGVDTVARLLAERLSLRLGQPVVVDNKPGAGATIGADALVRSAPDGYTLMLGSIIDYALAPHFQKNVGFDMRRDFAPVVEVGFGTVVMIVNVELPATSMKELIELAKKKPGQISFASSGTGGLHHLNMEMVKQMAGIDLVHVPYKGTSQLLPDLMAGRVQLTMDSLPAHLPNIRAGKTRALAVASTTRSPMLPEVPTMAESGLPGFESATNYTLFAPAGTPRDVIDLLNREANAMLKEQDLRDRLLALGIIVTGGSVAAVQARIPVEMDKWAAVIKAASVKIE